MSLTKAQLVALFIEKRNAFILTQFINKYTPKNIPNIIKHLRKLMPKNENVNVNPHRLYKTNINIEREENIKRLFASVIRTGDNVLHSAILFRNSRFLTTVIESARKLTYYHELSWGPMVINALEKIRKVEFPNEIFVESIYSGKLRKNIRL